MALFQPSNITPSDLSGAGTIDATEDMAVTWQVNGTGNTPMTAYKIDIMRNDTGSTMLYTTGQITLSDPFYGADSLGNPVYFTATIAKEALASAGIVNAVNDGYKLLITQWWSAADSVAQTSASAFIARNRPAISIVNFTEEINTISYTFQGLYTQAQGDPIEWARWQISTGNGGEVLMDTGRVYNMGRMEASYDGFISGNNYSVRLSGQTINGVGFDTDWQVFTAQYAQTTFDGVATACASCDTDAIQVNFPSPLYTMGRGGGDWSISPYTYPSAGPSAIVSIPDAAAAPVDSLTVGIEPVQTGSGDPSPDNVRPITGWTGAKVTRTGKNLLRTLSDTTAAGITYMVNADGSILVNGTSTSAAIAYFASGGTADNSLLASGTYTLSRFATEITGDAYLQITTRGKSTGAVFARRRITASTPISTFTITDAEYVSDMFIRLSAGAVAANAIVYPQLELGSTATAYEPYNGNTLSIDWESETGTVYGGTLNVAKGELVVDRAIKNVQISLGNYNSTINALLFYSSSGIFSDALAPANNNTPFSAIAESTNVNSASAINGGEYGIGLTATKDVYLRAVGASSKDDYLSIFPNGINVVYKLATPLTYTLTPQEIRTLLGANNIWADTGDTTVGYAKYVGGQNLNLPTASDSATWDSGDETALNLTTPFSLAWKGYVTDLSETANVFSILTGGGMMQLMADSTQISATVADTELFTVTRTMATTDEIIVGLQPGSWFVKITPSGGTETEYSGNLNPWQSEISAITLYGPQTCEYLWVVKGNFTADQMAETALNTPVYDSTTQFLASFDSGLSAGAIRTAEPVQQILVYRQTAGKSTIQKCATLQIGATALRDYGAVNSQVYTYYLYGVTENGTSTTVIASNPVSMNDWNFTVLECEADANGDYHVQNEFRFALDVTSGTESNNNKPTMQANFTPYPLRQPTTQSYRSSTLTSYIARVKNGQYLDSLTKIAQLRALSTSTATKFLKTRKGEILMIETGDPISMSVIDKYMQQPVRVGLPWVEVGSTEGINVITTTDDAYWTLGE